MATSAFGLCLAVLLRGILCLLALVLLLSLLRSRRTMLCRGLGLLGRTLTLHGTFLRLRSSTSLVTGATLALGLHATGAILLLALLLGLCRSLGLLALGRHVMPTTAPACGLL